MKQDIGVKGPRINITWRWVVADECGDNSADECGVIDESMSEHEVAVAGALETDIHTSQACSKASMSINQACQTEMLAQHKDSEVQAGGADEETYESIRDRLLLLVIGVGAFIVGCLCGDFLKPPHGADLLSGFSSIFCMLAALVGLGKWKRHWFIAVVGLAATWFPGRVVGDYATPTRSDMRSNGLIVGCESNLGHDGRLSDALASLSDPHECGLCCSPSFIQSS